MRGKLVDFDPCVSVVTSRCMAFPQCSLIGRSSTGRPEIGFDIVARRPACSSYSSHSAWPLKHLKLDRVSWWRILRLGWLSLWPDSGQCPISCDCQRAARIYKERNHHSILQYTSNSGWKMAQVVHPMWSFTSHGGKSSFYNRPKQYCTEVDEWYDWWSRHSRSQPSC